MKGLTDIAGVKVGHVSDFEARTGCTVMLFEGGALGGVDVRGSATGTQEFDLLTPLNATDRVHALVFSGGSAFGLETAAGVRRYLERKGVGFATSHGLVPLVPCAILYDLGVGKIRRTPTREMGEAAAAAASDGPVQEGSVGAGTGATVGKLFGYQRAMKSGVGTATVVLRNGVFVSALAVANAFGDIVDPGTGKIVAGARKSVGSREFSDTAQSMKEGAQGAFFDSTTAFGQNTTLAAVVTNARLNKVAATKLAQFASLGVARSIRPVWTTFDGDVTVALSIGKAEMDINTLGVAAAEAVSSAILRCVRGGANVYPG